MNSSSEFTYVDQASSLPLSQEQLKLQLKHQLEFYFSAENLSNDSYMLSQMDHEHYIPISTIASFNKVKNLTTDLKLVVEALRESPYMQVEQTGLKVRPVQKQRSIVILREIPQTTPVEEVEELFSGKNCPPFLSCEFGLNNSWYIFFETEDNAQRAYKYLREERGTFQGKPIMARIKAKQVLQSASQLPITSPRPAPSTSPPSPSPQPSPQQTAAEFSKATQQHHTMPTALKASYPSDLPLSKPNYPNISYITHFQPATLLHNSGGFPMWQQVNSPLISLDPSLFRFTTLYDLNKNRHTSQLGLSQNHNEHMLHNNTPLQQQQLPTNQQQQQPTNNHLHSQQQQQQYHNQIIQQQQHTQNRIHNVYHNHTNPQFIHNLQNQYLQQQYQQHQQQHQQQTFNHINTTTHSNNYNNNNSLNNTNKTLITNNNSNNNSGTRTGHADGLNLIESTSRFPNHFYSQQQHQQQQHFMNFHQHSQHHFQQQQPQQQLYTPGTGKTTTNITHDNMEHTQRNKKTNTHKHTADHPPKHLLNFPTAPFTLNPIPSTHPPHLPSNSNPSAFKSSYSHINNNINNNNINNNVAFNNNYNNYNNNHYNNQINNKYNRSNNIHMPTMNKQAFLKSTTFSSKSEANIFHNNNNNNYVNHNYINNNKSFCDNDTNLLTSNKSSLSSSPPSTSSPSSSSSFSNASAPFTPIYKQMTSHPITTSNISATTYTQHNYRNANYAPIITTNNNNNKNITPNNNTNIITTTTTNLSSVKESIATINNPPSEATQKLDSLTAPHSKREATKTGLDAKKFNTQYSVTKSNKDNNNNTIIKDNNNNNNNIIKDNNNNIIIKDNTNINNVSNNVNESSDSNNNSFKNSINNKSNRSAFNNYYSNNHNKSNSKNNNIKSISEASHESTTKASQKTPQTTTTSSSRPPSSFSSSSSLSQPPLSFSSSSSRPHKLNIPTSASKSSFKTSTTSTTTTTTTPTTTTTSTGGSGKYKESLDTTARKSLSGRPRRGTGAARSSRGSNRGRYAREDVNQNKAPVKDKPSLPSETFDKSFPPLQLKELHNGTPVNTPSDECVVASHTTEIETKTQGCSTKLSYAQIIQRRNSVQSPSGEDPLPHIHPLSPPLISPPMA